MWKLPLLGVSGRVGERQCHCVRPDKRTGHDVSFLFAIGLSLLSYVSINPRELGDRTWGDAAIIAAFNDAVADGKDIINLSFGGTPTEMPSESPIDQAVATAVKAGVTVVIAAGNEGASCRTAPCYATIGALWPAPPQPLATTANAVTVTLGSTPARVLFSGLAPGFAGLYQVNFEVPAGTGAGDAVSLSVSVANASANTVALPVR